MAKLEEPSVGSPAEIYSKGRRISQDIANSVIEYHSVMDAAAGTIDTVYELGAGYGRTAYVFLMLGRVKKYGIVDIPPALFVSETYLSQVFPERRVFPFRRFRSYSEVREEFEAAEIAFLLPTQMELIPGGSADLFMNISSFGEMTLAQIEYYIAQVKRLLRVGGHLYMKEWKESVNRPDRIVVRQEDYPVAEWEKVFWRDSPVQTRFFEALLRRPSD
jgi:putative sugar O-methyltransferase